MDYFSIHDLVTFKTNVDLSLPAYFKVRNLAASPDVEILEKELGFSRPEDADILKENYYFWKDEKNLKIEYSIPGVKVSVQDLLGEASVKFTPVYGKISSGDRLRRLAATLLSFKLVQKNYAMIHAASLSHDDEGILITTMQNTGKTSTVLSLLGRDENFKFLADDYSIIGGGKILCFPKPVNISPRTLTGGVVPPVESLSTRLTKIPAIGTIFRRFGMESQEYRQIPAEMIEDRAPVKKVFVITGYGREGVETIDEERASRAITLSTFHVKDLRFYEPWLNTYSYLFDLDAPMFFGQKRRIIKKTVSGAECFEVKAKNLRGYSEAIYRVLA